MSRLIVPGAEAILDQEVPVLDKGFVRLVDYLGGDARIVQSARVSYGAGTKTVREDKALIYYLMRNDHSSPFEQVVLTMHVKLPIFVARQMIRHRTARVNEVSGRYSMLADEFYVPDLEQIRQQSTTNKQGRGKLLSTEEQALIREDIDTEHARASLDYEDRLERGVARELARINLPLSLYTQWYWQIDLRNLFHFLRLRLDAHAQYEIRCYAVVMARMAHAVAPLAYAAFEEHVLHAVRLSRTDAVRIRTVLTSLSPEQTADILPLFPEEHSA